MTQPATSARRDAPTPPHTARPAARPGVRLLDAVPDLRTAVPAEARERARRLVVVPLHEQRAGAADDVLRDTGLRPFAAVLTGGFVVRETAAGGRAAAELLGPGDLVWLGGGGAGDEPDAGVRHLVHAPAAFAVLDDRFRRCAGAWPGLHEAVARRLARQGHRTAQALAVLHLARVEDRLVLALGALAARWGRVTPAGVVLEVDLTHALLGRLVGAARPTASLGLTELAARGLVVRREDRSWLVHPDVVVAGAGPPPAAARLAGGGAA